MPPQPEGVWSGLVQFGGTSWQDATGPDRYRRAVYTYIKRTSVYPSFLTFDASGHQLSLARRLPTNTPLQALVTLNDLVYREAAEALAQRMSGDISVISGRNILEDRLNYGARQVLSRSLDIEELKLLQKLYDNLIDRHKATEDKAMVEVASALLNLDAALTR